MSDTIYITMRMSRDKARALLANCDHHSREADSKILRDASGIAAQAIAKAIRLSDISQLPRPSNYGKGPTIY